MTENSEGPSTGDAREFIELDLRYETIRDLQAELAPRLSNDGLFLPSEEPVPPDTVVRFRVMLPGDFVLVEGTGVVLWTRAPGDENGPPGLAIRYATLPSESQETIDAIIDAHLASGGVLFNLEPESDAGESFPTDALDHRSLDAPGTPRSRPFSAAEDALSELEAARLTVRGDARPSASPSSSTGGSSEVALEDEYLASVERQVEQAIAGRRETDSQATEPLDQELIELTTDVVEPAARPLSLDIQTNGSTADGTGMEAGRLGEPTSPGESGPPIGGADNEIERVIPDFLDKWRHELEANGGNGGRTERLDFEPSAAEVEADATPGRDAEPGGEDDRAMAAGGPSKPRGGGRRWWLVLAGVGVAVVVVGYVVWLWSLGGEAPEPVPQLMEQAGEPSEDVVEVTTEHIPESEVEALEDTDAAQPAAPIPQPSLEPATAVESILWRSGAEGTEVVIRGNGAIAERTVETFGLSEPPRILIRLREIQQEYSAYELSVGTTEVEQIRVGHHPELTPPALYVVLDLARADARVVDVAVEGDTARVTVR